MNLEEILKLKLMYGDTPRCRDVYMSPKDGAMTCQRPKGHLGEHECGWGCHSWSYPGADYGNGFFVYEPAETVLDED